MDMGGAVLLIIASPERTAIGVSTRDCERRVKRALVEAGFFMYGAFRACCILLRVDVGDILRCCAECPVDSRRCVFGGDRLRCDDTGMDEGTH